MADQDILQFHAQSLRDYAELWFDPAARQEGEVSEAEAAYHLCEHAAMLFRYTNREVYLQGLMQQTPDQRRSLVLTACGYLAGLTLTDTARRLLAEDVLDADDLTRLEDLLIERDAIEEVLELATRLSCDLADDRKVRQALATARCMVAELDDVLWERPDALTVACRALSGLRMQLAVAPDQRRQWWFGKAVDLDESFERESLEKLLATASGPRSLPPPKSVIRLSASQFIQGGATVALAAADASSVRPDISLAALIPELPGVRVVITQLDPVTYQFVFIDQQTRERSTSMNGNRLVASRGNSELATAPITAGVAMLRGCGDFDSCRIETADGRALGTLVLDTDDV